MFSEPALAISAPHKVEIDPHRLFDSRFTDVHDERAGQVRRPVFPRGERQFRFLIIGWAEANAKR
jgi:hypothetical protein